MAIETLAQQYQAVQVRIVGSVARQEARRDSDIDFLVQFAPGASLYDLAGLRQALSELLGCPVDVISDHPRLSPQFRRWIEQEAVPL